MGKGRDNRKQLFSLNRRPENQGFQIRRLYGDGGPGALRRMWRHVARLDLAYEERLFLIVSSLPPFLGRIEPQHADQISFGMQRLEETLEELGEIVAIDTRAPDHQESAI